MRHISRVLGEGERRASSWRRPRRFSREKPIVAYKAGRGIESAKAVKSHTAAIAGEYAFYKALFKQTGLIEADLYELFNMAQALALSPPRGDKVLIIVGKHRRTIRRCVDRVRLKDTRSVGWCQIRLKAHAPLHRLSREPSRSNWKRHIRKPIRALATALDEYDMALVATLAHPPDLDEGIADIILDAVKRDKPIAVVSIGRS